ncbi:MAG: thioredoxin family protein [Kiritimatiellae bacterium]|nr:thioredoxin family protein [Kiritimatiellia bacterium]
MKRMRLLLGLILILAAGAGAQDPFSVTAALDTVENGAHVLSLSFSVPPDHYLYADRIRVTLSAPPGAALGPGQMPAAKEKTDPFTGEPVQIYSRDFTARYVLTGLHNRTATVTVGYQGCTASTCFLPATHTFNLASDGAPPSGPSPDAAGTPAAIPAGPAGWRALLESFETAGTQSGYLRPAAFTAFLDHAEQGARKEGLVDRIVTGNIWLSALLIFVFGIGLNLTPCVLPMIPINIAIIGAGAQAGSRAKGLALGATYGAGIAIAYGVLGLVVVLTRSAFGTLNANPWFNIGIALVFLLLALAMFGLFNIDLSRFQTAARPGTRRRGSFVLAFSMGAVAALLAGACVAPVVIATVVRAGNLYAAGQNAALLLPFVLGAGMALPWPLAGAGLSFLPKPGKWMQWVKYAFGTIILIAALYYGATGIGLFRVTPIPDRAGRAQVESDTPVEGWLESLPEALEAGRRQLKPIFIDFWASWCKNCLAMEKTTFKDPEVRGRLEGYVRLKFQAENPSAPETKAVLEAFGVRGLPTFVILRPRAEPPSDRGAPPGRP